MSSLKASKDTGNNSTSGSSMFNIASIRDRVLQKLNTSESDTPVKPATILGSQASDSDPSNGHRVVEEATSAQHFLSDATDEQNSSNGNAPIATFQQAPSTETKDTQKDAESSEGNTAPSVNVSLPSAFSSSGQRLAEKDAQSANSQSSYPASRDGQGYTEMDTSTSNVELAHTDCGDGQGSPLESGAAGTVNDCSAERDTVSGDSSRDDQTEDGETLMDTGAQEEGTENILQNIVIKSEKVDEGYDLHSTSSTPGEFVQLDQNVVVKREDDGGLPAGGKQDGDHDDDVIITGHYRVPDSDSDSDSSVLSFDEDDFVPETNTNTGFVDVRTRGEIAPEDLPPLEDLKISLCDETRLIELGVVSGIVGVLVVIESTPQDYGPVNDDTVLFLEDRTPFGTVFEVFGNCKSPYYSVRFNSPEDIVKKEVKIGLTIYFAPRPAPTETHITNYVFLSQLLKMKGSDASWANNNEPPAEMLDYSDDEAEQEARAKRKAEKRAKQNKKKQDDPSAQKKRDSTPGREKFGEHSWPSSDAAHTFHLPNGPRDNDQTSRTSRQFGVTSDGGRSHGSSSFCRPKNVSQSGAVGRSSPLLPLPFGPHSNTPYSQSSDRTPPPHSPFGQWGARPATSPISEGHWNGYSSQFGSFQEKAGRKLTCGALASAHPGLPFNQGQEGPQQNSMDLPHPSPPPLPPFPLAPPPPSSCLPGLSQDKRGTQQNSRDPFAMSQPGHPFSQNQMHPQQNSMGPFAANQPGHPFNQDPRDPQQNSMGPFAGNQPGHPFNQDPRDPQQNRMGPFAGNQPRQPFNQGQIGPQHSSMGPFAGNQPRQPFNQGQIGPRQDSMGPCPPHQPRYPFNQGPMSPHWNSTDQAASHQQMRWGKGAPTWGN